MAIEQMLEDIGWAALGATPPTVEEAQEVLKLTDEDIAGVYQRYEKLLDEMLSSPAFYELLKKTQAL